MVLKTTLYDLHAVMSSTSHPKKIGKRTDSNECSPSAFWDSDYFCSHDSMTSPTGHPQRDLLYSCRWRLNTSSLPLYKDLQWFKSLGAHSLWLMFTKEWSSGKAQSKERSKWCLNKQFLASNPQQVIKRNTAKITILFAAQILKYSFAMHARFGSRIRGNIQLLFT